MAKSKTTSPSVRHPLNVSPIVPRLWRRRPPGCSRPRPGAGRAPSRGCIARAGSARSDAVAFRLRDRRRRRRRRPQARRGALTRSMAERNSCDRPQGPSHSPLLTFTDLSHEYHESSALSDSSFLFAAPPPRYRQIPNVRRRIVFLTRTPAPAERRRGSGRGRLPHLLLLCPPPRPPPTRNIKAGSMLTAPGRRPPRLAARHPCLPPLGPLLPSSSGFFAALRPPFPPLAFLAANSFDPQRVRAPTNGGNLSND